MNLQTAYRLDEHTLLVPRRVRIGPDDPEWEKWAAVAVPVPANWGGKVRAMFLRTSRRSRVSPQPAPSPEPRPEPPAAVVKADRPAPAPRPSDLLTVAEAAPLLKHSPYTVRDWIKRGDLRREPRKIGQNIVVRRAEVERFIREGPAAKPGRRAVAGKRGV